MLGNVEFTPEQIDIADINGDGTVDVLDVIQLVNIILGDSRTTSEDRQELRKQLSKIEDFNIMDIYQKNITSTEQRKLSESERTNIIKNILKG